MSLCTAKCLVHYENLWTFELKYPRYIHSEFMTHRMFSRNASSSRAIPVAKAIQQVEENPVIPETVFMNKSGMVGDTEADSVAYHWFKKFWKDASKDAVEQAKKMNALGIHKQHINRILEPFQYISVIVTATEWDNFFKLRRSKDAQPEMQDLANAIYEEMERNKDKEFGVIVLHEEKEEDVDAESLGSCYYLGFLSYEEYEEKPLIISLPYVTESDIEKLGTDNYGILMKISSARCARVSYNNHDGSTPNIDKDLELFKRLFKGEHMSPFEHQCVKDDLGQWHANLHGWKSFRKYLEG